MKKLIAIAAVAVSLAGCKTMSGGNVSALYGNYWGKEYTGVRTWVPVNDRCGVVAEHYDYVSNQYKDQTNAELSCKVVKW